MRQESLLRGGKRGPPGGRAPRRAPRRSARAPAPGRLARCLVATDLAPASRWLLERAARLVAAGGGEIHLLHVHPPHAPEPLRGKMRAGLARAVAAARAAARLHGARRVRVTASLRTGEPYIEIIRCARELAADIVLIGRGKAGLLRGGAIGTTAARVIRMGDVPTLLVGRRPRSAYRRPLIAIEIDPSARDLIELTRRVVGSDEVPLRVLHVYRVPFESYLRSNPNSSAAAYFQEAKRSAAASMATMLESTGSSRFRLQPALRRGDARSAIRNEAVRHRADLIAIGTHGRSGVAHMMLGSVAEWVIGNSSRDVLVARPVRFTFIPP